jgi:hypothetical protein
VTNDDKVQNGYSSSRNRHQKFDVSCFFYVWVLFVCLQGSVFVFCSLMEQRECVVFNDGVGSLLHDGWFLWGM